MNEEVNQVPIHPGDSEVVESWLRETEEPGVRNVNAIRIESPDDITGWQVAVWTMEYVRSDPLETELRSRISDALRVVSGVTSAAEQDRETWFVTGSPSGKALVAAVAPIVDDLTEQRRPYAGY